MNDQLNEALTKLIEKALSGIDAAGDFMAGEIPEVINQLLVWHAVESAMWFSIWLLVSIALCYHLKKNNSKMVDWCSGGGEPIILLVWSCPVVTYTITLANIEWLKILIAPKLYLLEYAAKMVS